jgi:hypothetical protein
MPSMVNAGLSAVSLVLSLVLAFALATFGCVSGHKSSRSTPLRDASVEAVEVPPPELRATPKRTEREATPPPSPPVVAAPAVARAAMLAHAIREPRTPELPPLPPPEVALPVPSDESSSAAPLPEITASLPDVAMAGGGAPLASARTVLGTVSVADCRARGLPGGYGHARVTFGATGNPTRVLVDGADGLSPDAIACVAERLAAAKVEPFDGSPLTVGTGWYFP